jgi:uncharacterized protein (TIGR00725 family)
MENHKSQNPSQTLKYKIAVSGAADTEFMPADALPKAEMIGRLIAEHGMVTVTGATTGAPYWAAKGAKEAGGIVIGVSPASTKREHMKTYGLPVEYHDLILYTGFGYAGRNLLFTRAADAIISIAGRIGTLNEFTDAFEDKKPQGVLLHAGGTTDLIEEILKVAHRGMGKVVFDADPKALVEKVVAMIEREEKEREIE